jgi:hypothetical protein
MKHSEDSEFATGNPKTNDVHEEGLDLEPKINIKTIIIICIFAACHWPFPPGTSLEPTVIPTAQASSFTLQYFPYYV